MKKGFRVYKVGLLLISFMILSGFFLFNTNTFADDTVIDTVRITVPSSCSLTSGLSGDGNYYQVNMLPGQYKNDIGPSTFSVFCNNNEGFSIYAIGFSNNEYGNTKMLSSDPDVYIQTGTNTSGSPSSWAMKMTAVTSSGEGSYTPTIVSPYNNFAVVPTTYTKVATVTSSITSNTEASVEATYAIYVTPDQIADTYTGKVKYTVVNPATNIPNEPKTCAANKICYWPNAGNEVVDSMGDQSRNFGDNNDNITSNMDVNLSASNFKRTGYSFVGWSDKFDWELNANDANGNGTGNNTGYHIYGPMANINVGDVSTKGLSLYAVWAPSAGSLQGWNGCSSLGQGRVTALTDLRDNDTYAVAKLADGKCWMIENLRLDYDANFDESLSQGFGKSTTYGDFVGLAEPETADFSNSTTANSRYISDGTGSIYNTSTNPITKTDIGTDSYPGFRMPRYRNDNMIGSNQNVYSYGNYYTWAAAMASTTHYSSYTATDADGKTSETVNTSLCPAGWKLPRGGNKSREATNDFWTLIVTGINNGTKPANYDNTSNPDFTGDAEGKNVSRAIRNYPNNFLNSGYTGASSIDNRSTNGRYWSSTAYSDYNSNYMRLDSSSVSPGTYNYYKTSGYSIRCIAGN